MKIFVTIARVLVGCLFIFSGLVKAIDPLGLSYKMQEFFEAWASSGFLSSLMNLFHTNSLLFSVITISLEVLLGVALLVGWQKKITLKLLFVLMLFFTFLTSYALFSGKIRECGCFGNCIPLTPIQTFTKDIILLALVVFLLYKQRFIELVFKNTTALTIVLISTFGVFALQHYVSKYLPIKDCLPYKVGNDILQLRKMPEGAIPDKFAYVFVYKKGTEQKEFSTDKLPDSTWTYVDRKQTLIQKGINNTPLINDFSLTDSSGIDVTETILSQPSEYYLVFIKDLVTIAPDWTDNFAHFLQKAAAKNKKIYVITADASNVNNFINDVNKFNLPIYTCDATAIKTAARANPTIFAMKGSVVQGKYSWATIADIEK